MTTERVNWEVIGQLKTTEEQAAFLNACIDKTDDDSALMLEALHAIALAQGVDDLAAFARLDPGSLSADCELSFKTFVSAVNALGMRLSVSVR